MSEMREIREELAKLRERVAVLESINNRVPVGPITPWPVPHYDQFKPPPWMPPFVVTCESTPKVLS